MISFKNGVKKPFAVFTSGILFGLLMSCTSTIKIESQPTEALVFVSEQNSVDKKPLGKTPVTIASNDLIEKAGGKLNSGDFLVLTVEAKDHETQRLLMPVPVLGTTETNIFVKLLNNGDKKDSLYREILQRLHNAQKYAQSGSFERALIETDKALELDSKFERALSMKGSIYFLQKNYSEALKWFDEALRIDPAFDEAIKMINRIKAEMK